MTPVVGTVSGSHHHVVAAYLSIVADGDRTCATARWTYGNSTNNVILAYRGQLAAAVDAALNLGLTLNGDGAVATHQTGVAMSSHTLSGTVDVALDDGCTCLVALEAYRHVRVMFQSGNLTAAIDVAFHRAVADGDIRVIGHGLVALEVGI